MRTRNGIAASFVLALIGTTVSQAAIITTDQTGGSEVLLNLVNTVDSSTYTLDLGIKFDDLNVGSVFNLDAGATAFINSAGMANIEFGIIAANVNTDQYLTSSPDPNFLETNVSNAIRSTWKNSIDELIANLNAGYPSAGTNAGYGPIPAGPSPNYVGGGHDLWQGSVDNTGPGSGTLNIYLVTFGTSLLGNATKALVVAEPASLTSTQLTIGSGGGGPITGTSGPDNLTGTAGKDVIDGKGGADTMTGLAGNDIYYVQHTGDEVVETPGGGTDTVRSTITYTLPPNVEKLVLRGSNAINGNGNVLNNTMTGNNAANKLDGKGGADTMTGKGGNDTYYVNHGADKVVEKAGEGTDTVRSAVTYTLPANVENLVLTGNAAINGNGNTLANKVTGNGANNTLNGRQGNDTLSGGAGQDRFLFNTALSSTNIDRITDFKAADDTIRLENAIFTALTTTGTLAASTFSATSSATTAAHRILYDPATGYVRYDPDGTGPVAARRFATLTTKPALTRADFVVQ